MIRRFRLYGLSILLILTAREASAEPANIKFTPTSIEQLSGAIELLKSRSAEMKVAESDFKFDDSIDGIKGRGTSKIESALYASIVFGENKTAVMDALYYFERCTLKNEKKSYNKGLATLARTAEKAFAVTAEEIDEIIIRAHYDHLRENNAAARKLTAAGREDLVAVVARARVTRSKDDKKEILRKAIELASQAPMPIALSISFSNIIALLVDPKLQKAVVTVFEKSILGDQGYKNEQY